MAGERWAGASDLRSVFATDTSQLNAMRHSVDKNSGEIRFFHSR